MAPTSNGFEREKETKVQKKIHVLFFSYGRASIARNTGTLHVTFAVWCLDLPASANPKTSSRIGNVQHVRKVEQGRQPPGEQQGHRVPGLPAAGRAHRRQVPRHEAHRPPRGDRGRGALGGARGRGLGKE